MQGGGGVLLAHQWQQAWLLCDPDIISRDGVVACGLDLQLEIGGLCASPFA